MTALAKCPQKDNNMTALAEWPHDGKGIVKQQ
jgi:hypothetical protein